MTERPAATPFEVAASESDVLLATKLYVPMPQSGFVPRRRLVDVLNAALRRELILVCAPAGFGKTALLADWVRHGGRPAAWLSLDAGDSDPARFWRHALAALEHALPGVAEPVMPLLGPPAPASFDGLVTALINEITARADDGRVVLVLDDYHLIDAAPVHASLAFLLEHQPPGLHLVLASRADPPLPLARLRAQRQLAELRAAELRFTSEEAALLTAAAGLELPEAAVTALEARTEGWAVGLHLAALSLRAETDVAGFVATFSGSNRYVLDYLAEEVLERQTEQLREFMLETALLERLSGELCDAVTGRTNGQAMLEALEAAGLFLVPLDDVRGWWRYHHLFADLLQMRLHQQQPGRIPGLHRAAAGWHEKRGLANEAIGHALAAGDVTWAAQLIERHADAHLLRAETLTVQRWFAALPAELVRSRPRLLLAQAWMALVGGQVDGAGPLLDAADRASANASDEPYEPSAGRALSWLANVPAMLALSRAALAQLRGDAEGTAAFASQALGETGEGELMLDSTARWLLGVAEWLRGRLVAAERAFATSITGWRAAGERFSVAYGCHHLGQVQRAQGRLDAALDTYQQAVEITAAPGQPAVPAAGIAYVGLAEVAYQRNQLDAALDHVTEGIALCRQLSYAQPLATGLATLAWIRQAYGDAAAAVDAMGEGGRVAPGPAVTGLLNSVPEQRARLMLAQGEVAAAARWTAERGLSPDDEPDYPREPEYLVLARVLLAQERPSEALQLLQRLLTLAARQGRVGSIIELRALQTLALAASGDDAAAIDALAEALTLACPAGYIRVFADEGAPMRAVLARLVAVQRTEPATAPSVPLDYIARLLDAFDVYHPDPGSVRAAAATRPGLVEPLTAREVEVLGLLAVGKSNPRIAEELVVTLDTVKKHVSHIFSKLGATNRTEAVIRARQLGLLT